MLWSILFAIVCAAVLFFLGRKDSSRKFDWFGFFFFSVIAFMAGLFVSVLMSLVVPKQWVQTETIRLVSLRSGDNIGGDFTLGTGSIGATQYYFFYKEAGLGYRPGKVAVADNVTVFEAERENGELRVYTLEFATSFAWWIAIDPKKGEETRKKYEFSIPNGSLKRNFMLQ